MKLQTSYVVQRYFQRILAMNVIYTVFFLQTKKEERDLKMVNWNEAEEKDLT